MTVRHKYLVKKKRNQQITTFKESPQISEMLPWNISCTRKQKLKYKKKKLFYIFLREKKSLHVFKNILQLFCALAI